MGLSSRVNLDVGKITTHCNVNTIKFILTHKRSEPIGI